MVWIAYVSCMPHFYVDGLYITGFSFMHAAI